MPVTSTNVRDIWRRLISAVGSTEEAVADKLGPARYNKGVHKIADAAAADILRLTFETATDADLKIDECKVTLSAAVALNGATYATLSLVYNDGAGGANTTIGTLDTSATAFVANVPRAMTLTDANRVVPAGSMLQLVQAKASTGVIVAAGSAIVKGYYQ